MDQEDVRLVNGMDRTTAVIILEAFICLDLGRFSADQLMDYIKGLQNNAFVLGVEESQATNMS